MNLHINHYIDIKRLINNKSKSKHSLRERERDDININLYRLVGYILHQLALGSSAASQR